MFPIFLTVERIPGQMPALSSSAAEYLANLQLAQGTPEVMLDSVKQKGLDNKKTLYTVHK